MTQIRKGLKGDVKTRILFYRRDGRILSRFELWRLQPERDKANSRNTSQEVIKKENTHQCLHYIIQIKEMLEAESAKIYKQIKYGHQDEEVTNNFQISQLWVSGIISLGRDYWEKTI